MPRFFVSESQIRDGRITVTDDDALHISRSLRMATGDRAVFSDGQGQEFMCRLTAFTEDTVEAQILEVRKGRGESPLRIHLYQGYPKADKLETIIAKSVELGVTSVTPFLSEFCIKRPAGERKEKILARQHKIALEAAKQCGRSVLPSVFPTLSFTAALQEATAKGPVLFCYEGEGTVPLSQVLRTLPTDVTDISVVVGSEGGFSPKEAEAAARAGCRMTGLGSRILRCETAPLFVLSCLSFAFELAMPACVAK